MTSFFTESLPGCERSDYGRVNDVDRNVDSRLRKPGFESFAVLAVQNYNGQVYNGQFISHHIVTVFSAIRMSNWL